MSVLEKIRTAKKAAKPKTPDEIGSKKSTKVKTSSTDPANLRSSTGSTASIHLFRAIRALPDEHIPIIIEMLKNEQEMRKGRYRLMQPVYILFDGNGQYVNDYVLGYVISATDDTLKVINKDGTFTGSFPLSSTSILTVEDFEKEKASLLPADQKPAKRNKQPILPELDFEPPTINDLVDAGATKAIKAKKSDLYTLFTQFSSGSPIEDGTLHKAKKKKKKTVKPETELSKSEKIEDFIVVDGKEYPQVDHTKDKICNDAKSEFKIKIEVGENTKFEGITKEEALKKFGKKPSLADYGLANQDFSWYETEPGKEVPKIVQDQIDAKENAAKTEKAAKPKYQNRPKLAPVTYLSQEYIEAKDKKTESKTETATKVKKTKKVNQTTEAEATKVKKPKKVLKKKTLIGSEGGIEITKPKKPTFEMPSLQETQKALKTLTSLRF